MRPLELAISIHSLLFVRTFTARSADQTTRETIVKRKSNYLFGFELRARRASHATQPWPKKPFELGICSWCVCARPANVMIALVECE